MDEASRELNSNGPIKIIRRADLARVLGVSYTTLWRIRDSLPPQVQISKGVRGWRAGDIERWMQSRVI